MLSGMAKGAGARFTHTDDVLCTKRADTPSSTHTAAPFITQTQLIHCAGAAMSAPQSRKSCDWYTPCSGASEVRDLDAFTRRTCREADTAKVITMQQIFRHEQHVMGGVIPKEMQSTPHLTFIPLRPVVNTDCCTASDSGTTCVRAKVHRW